MTIALIHSLKIAVGSYPNGKGVRNVFSCLNRFVNCDLREGALILITNTGVDVN